MNNIAPAQIFFSAPKSSLNQFTSKDREYFSKPIPVTQLRTDTDGLVWVRDEVRGHTYPVSKANLSTFQRLHHKTRDILLAA